MLTPEQIKAAARLVTQPVECPAWGGQVIVKQMSGLEKVAFSTAYAEARKHNSDKVLPCWQAMLCIAAMCDEAGTLLYPWTTAPELVERAVALAALPSSAPTIEAIFDDANRLNRFFGEEAEEPLKNSEQTPSAAGP